MFGICLFLFSFGLIKLPIIPKITAPIIHSKPILNNGNLVINSGFEVMSNDTLNRLIINTATVDNLWILVFLMLKNDNTVSKIITGYTTFSIGEAILIILVSPKLDTI